MITLPPLLLPGTDAERVDFDLPDVRHALTAKSVRLWWEGATTCPCSRIITNKGVTQSTGEPQGNCLVCGSSTIAYDAGQQTIGMLLGTNDQQRRFLEPGPQATGYAYLTTFPENLPKADDRFTLFDGWRIHSERRQRLALTPERMRYPIQRRAITTGGGLNLQTPVVKTVGVLHCRYTDTTGTVQPTTLVEGTHLTVTADGEVDFTLGDDLGVSPPVGGFYSLRYFCRPVFVVIDHVYIRRDLFNRTDLGSLHLGEHPIASLVMAEHLGTRNAPIVTWNPQPTWAMKG